jgi:hypothetical protein
MTSDRIEVARTSRPKLMHMHVLVFVQASTCIHDVMRALVHTSAVG